MKTLMLQKRTTLGVLLVAMVQACATTPDLSAGNPLPGIGLEASGDSVLLSWDQEGPLARQLTPNSNVQLVASYSTENGSVTGEPIASARVGAIYSGVKFDLPDDLRNIASGPVCLRITHNRRAIPVRIARPGESSDGFYYDEWVAVANGNRALRVLEKDKSTIDSNVENFQAGDEDFLTWRRESGLSTRSDCGTLEFETVTQRPATALTGGQRAIAARQQCTALFARFPNKKFYRDVAPLAGLRPGLTGKQLASEVRANIPAGNRLASTANQIVSDLETYGAGYDYYKVARLPIVQEARDALFLDNRGEITETSAISLAEAYSGCLSETEGRLEQSYNSWQASRDPALRIELTNARREECRVRFDDYQQKEDRLRHWQERQTEVNGKIAALKANMTTALPSRKPLIPESCPFS